MIDGTIMNKLIAFSVAYLLPGVDQICLMRGKAREWCQPQLRFFVKAPHIVIIERTTHHRDCKFDLDQIS